MVHGQADGTGEKIMMTEAERKRELDYIIEFAKTANFAEEHVAEQLCSLFTAYCLHSDYAHNTRLHNYDLDIYAIWNETENNPSCPWHDINDCDAYIQFYCDITQSV